MSEASFTQLQESYHRIINDTLRRVRDSRLLRNVGSEALDELESRWRTAVEKELKLMRTNNPRLGQGPPLSSSRHGQIVESPSKPNSAAEIYDLPLGSTFGARTLAAPSRLSGTSTWERGPNKRVNSFNHMHGVEFDVEPLLPNDAAALANGPSAWQMAGKGFMDSHTPQPLEGDGSSGPLPSPPPLKQARRDERQTDGRSCMGMSEGSDCSKISPGVAAMPLAGASQSSSAIPTPVVPVADEDAVADGDDDDDDDLDGCFDDAEEIVTSFAAIKRTPPTTAGHTPSPAQPSSCPSPSPSPAADAAEPPKDSQLVGGGGNSTAHSASEALAAAGEADCSDEGSPLGSDLDDDEFEEPNTQNLLTGELTKVQKTKKGWKLQFRRGLLAVDGIECLFSTLQGTFDLPDS